MMSANKSNDTLFGQGNQPCQLGAAPGRSSSLALRANNPPCLLICGFASAHQPLISPSRACPGGGRKHGAVRAALRRGIYLATQPAWGGVGLGTERSGGSQLLFVLPL